LGDSILDNKVYVGGDSPDVITQLKNKIKKNNLPWKAKLCAIDGDVIGGISEQLQSAPKDTTVFVLSVGGNDGLRYISSHLPRLQMWNPFQMYNLLSTFLDKFQKDYSNMLDEVVKKCNRTIVCTIYSPQWKEWFLGSLAKMGLIFVNRIISNEAQIRKLPIIDVYNIFDQSQDYANPIEPACPGGDKITNNIIHIVKRHEWGTPSIYDFKDYDPEFWDLIEDTPVESKKEEKEESDGDQDEQEEEIETNDQKSRPDTALNDPFRKSHPSNQD